MNTEKMREEFEARFPIPVYVFWCDKTRHYLNHGNPLGCLTYRGQWEGWQESRAAIEVELPKERSVNGHWPEQVASDMGFNDGVELCRDAIESLGLKVKP